MEDPEQEITRIIHLLTQTPPSVQAQIIDKYFLPDASFIHPFCRTGSFQNLFGQEGWNSRALIKAIYRWYKILSPKIDLTVDSVAYDPTHLTLYITLHQLFRIWAIPLHRSHVTLVTVLHLSPKPRDPQNNLLYISQQNDLYQTDQWIRFLLPPAFLLVMAWQFLATGMSLLGTWVFWPVSWVEEVWGPVQISREVAGGMEREGVRRRRVQGERGRGRGRGEYGGQGGGEDGDGSWHVE